MGAEESQAGVLWLRCHLLSCLAEEPTFRCDECDELFPCKVDLRRHKKYACGSAGTAVYEGLGEGLKPEGLGGGGSDQAHECKDCERMFPTKYRCASPGQAGAGQGGQAPAQRDGAGAPAPVPSRGVASFPPKGSAPVGRPLTLPATDRPELWAPPGKGEDHGRPWAHCPPAPARPLERGPSR